LAKTNPIPQTSGTIMAMAISIGDMLEEICFAMARLAKS